MRCRPNGVARGEVLPGEPVMHAFLYFIDRLTMWTGKAFSWCVVILTLGVSYDIFVRKIFGAPTPWAYDFSYIMYGALFMMAGAYTLSRDGHVRCDVIYRLFSPRVQAALDLTLFVIFFFPGVLALIYTGVHFARLSWRFMEVSTFSPANIPIYPSKTLIPIAGALLLLQGISEVVRCIRCIRSGQWPERIRDVEETESVILHEQEDMARLGEKE
jgi:TRAP-type mannitol/chloroaromatic compound transport system permease small subunit